MNALSPLSPIEAGSAGTPVAKKAAAPSPEVVRVAKSFESVLVTKLVEEMARTVEESPLGEDSAAGQVNDMFYYGLADDISAKGGLGLWKQIARQMASRAGDSDAPAAREVVR